MLYQMQKTLSLYRYTIPKVLKIREGTITLLNLTTQKIKVPLCSFVYCVGNLQKTGENEKLKKKKKCT